MARQGTLRSLGGASVILVTGIGFGLTLGGMISPAASGQSSTPPAPAPATPAPATPPAPPASPAPGAPSAPPGNAVPEEVMKDLEKAAREVGRPLPSATPGTTPGVGPGAGPNAGPNAPGVATVSGSLLREGSFIASRAGRMARGAAGEWLLTFENDAKGTAIAPMVLMPCLNLMAMEKLAERGGESISFTVSGQVFVYKGRNYLLPTLYTVNKPTDLKSGG